MSLLDAPADRDRARAELVAWFDANARELPWRKAPHRGDPYATLVSEVMAQQTRVETAVPYFERWMARWPTIEDLAAADADEVLHAWQGLGYYDRARRMHAAAQEVASELDGVFPRTARALEALPGVGPYTAAAVASLCFDEPVPCVDGNVARVVARLDIARVDIGDPAVRRATRERLAPLLAGERPGAVNEALMELGATVCTPTGPRCEVCPLADPCQARARGVVDEVPAPSPKRSLPTVAVTAVLVEEEGRVLLRQRPVGGLLGGLWGLPMAEAGEPVPGGLAGGGPVLAEVPHTFTHKRWRVRVVAARPGAPPEGARWRWVAPRDLDALAVSTLDRRVFEALEPPRVPSAP